MPGSRNLWLIFGAVVALFAVIGPFGTLETLPFLQRLAFWFILHAAAWMTALISAVFGNILLEGVIASMFWRMMIGSLVAAVPIGAIIQTIRYLWFGHIPTGTTLFGEMLATLPLCAIFCVISYLAMSSNGDPTIQSDADPAAIPFTPTTSASPEPALLGCPLMARLKPENRGALCFMSVEDHYTHVKTRRGRELVLLRFADAIRETGNVDGLQVHRSHWVARDFVTGVNRTGGKTTLVLADGAEIPVSRPYIAQVRALFQSQS
nr:LytTR family DNA-binding domain-containing protein [Rhizobium setariae]